MWKEVRSTPAADPAGKVDWRHEQGCRTGGRREEALGRASSDPLTGQLVTEAATGVQCTMSKRAMRSSGSTAEPASDEPEET